MSIKFNIFKIFKFNYLMFVGLNLNFQVLAIKIKTVKHFQSQMNFKIFVLLTNAVKI